MGPKPIMSEIDLTTTLKANGIGTLSPLGAASINETLAGVSDVCELVCGRDTAWLADLHQELPDLPPSEARFISLLLIAHKCHLIQERTLDLLVAEREVNPSLQNLIDELQSEGQR